MSKRVVEGREERERTTLNDHSELKQVWIMVEGLDALDQLSLSEESEEQPSSALSKVCDWCGDYSGYGYFVAVDEERYGLCAICWGRAPTYVELRRENLSHEEAYQKLMGPPE